MEEKSRASELLETQLADSEQKEIKRVEINKHLEKRLKLKNTVWYICGMLEVLFTFRLVFKVIGANPTSIFVRVIYNVSGAFLAPFNGIFRAAVSNGVETKSVLEPMIIIAMIVYATLAYGIVRLIEIYDPKRVR
ncbi:YggT family protein [Fusibacter sp. 3D3]|uniref:YggT family protein n=1 Tax=Fusibacter sp. 3D3 TaxID=1048380 RepID=UPI0008578F9A|nr:YggT family protein [Fusibacter sp. 3D3]GAU76291.1 hypothetical protein F3D3_0888 [Fusibacter sp. 3D3]